ncbi:MULTISPECIES: hypothetical protein [unclassified Nocardioides]|uniref:hypothetical protein n=1 Tax=unclassified Nocardioides TaxID=2615069 RepID=UPI00360F4197
MSAYRRTWNVAVSVAALVALLGGGAQLGWWALTVSVGMIAGLGAAFGWSWEDRGPRRRIAGLCARWFGVIGLLLVGLPNAIGGWAMPVLLMLGLSAPRLLQRVTPWLHSRWPTLLAGELAELSDRDLERRWRRTSERLNDAHTTPAMALDLVRERQGLLDELERRHPDDFAARVVRAD